MMTKKIILLTIAIAFYQYSFCQVRKDSPKEFSRTFGEKLLTKGMRISSSGRIKKQTYKLDADTSMTRSVIIIEGNNIIVDFNNAILKGSNKKTSPDEFFGVALFIKGGKNITIRNLKAKGYKVALLARDVTNLTIENCDFSYNYRQHLNSTQEKEDISDWLSHHQNEKDEWLRYGAGMYLNGCDSMNIKNTKVTGGQNALMMTNSNYGKIYNNDFSFNSGLGIGMYRSNFNTIAYNKINFNVRGYSHGVYNRGQDSAGILIYEQSSNNYFYKNSVTHGGDGFFLWAGQTTMDSGKGGCNDNKLVKNDFSFAPTNGIEVTFSRNTIMDNRIIECDHGIWGGYSYNTVIAGNLFRSNRIAIAIEHGQENGIHHNIFHDNKEAIRLWGRKEQPADWGYAKNRDTRSRDYTITNNNFTNNKVVLSINRTEELDVFENIYSGHETLFKTDSTVIGLDTTWNEEVFEKIVLDSAEEVPNIASPQNPFKGQGALAGRKNIMITEWGPYDFRYPIIWNTNPVDTGLTMKFDVMGPKGMWRVISTKGIEQVRFSKTSLPSEITAIRRPGDKINIEILLEFIGDSFTDQFGNQVAAKKPYRFSFKKFFQPIDFNVLWYAYDFKMHDPIKTGMIIPPTARLKPVKEEKTTKLDYAWWGGIKSSEGDHPQFVTSATGSATFEKGEYELGVTWDDAVRVYLDGKLIIDEWNPSLYKFDESPHKTVKLSLEGKHGFTVEHAELGGFATLSLKIRKL